MKITRKKAIKAMKKVIADAEATHGPDVRYVDVAQAINPAVMPGGCWYTLPSSDDPEKRVPACLIGQVLHHLDVPGREVWETSSVDIDWLAEDLAHVVRFTERARRALGLAQVMQDNGHPWRRALESAVEGS